MPATSPYLAQPRRPLQAALDAVKREREFEDFMELVGGFRRALKVDEDTIRAEIRADHDAEFGRPKFEPVEELWEPEAAEAIAEAKAERLRAQKDALAEQVREWLAGLDDHCMGGDFKAAAAELATIATRVKALGAALDQIERGC